jgi:hypothetical protein
MSDNKSIHDRISSASAIGMLIVAVCMLVVSIVTLRNTMYVTDLKSYFYSEISHKNNEIIAERTTLTNEINLKKNKLQALEDQLQKAKLAKALVEEKSSKLRGQKAILDRDFKNLFENIEVSLWNLAYPSVYYRCINSVVVPMKSVLPHHQVVAIKGIDQFVNIKLAKRGNSPISYAVQQVGENNNLIQWSSYLFSIASDMKIEIDAIYFVNPVDLPQYGVKFYIEPLLSVGHVTSFSEGRSKEFKQIAFEISNQVYKIFNKLVTAMQRHMQEPSKIDSMLTRYGLKNKKTTLADSLTVSIYDMKQNGIKLSLYRAVVNQRVILRELTKLLFPGYAKHGPSALPFTDKAFRDKLVLTIGAPKVAAPMPVLPPVFSPPPAAVAPPP